MQLELFRGFYYGLGIIVRLLGFSLNLQDITLNNSSFGTIKGSGKILELNVKCVCQMTLFGNCRFIDKSFFFTNHTDRELLRG